MCYKTGQIYLLLTEMFFVGGEYDKRGSLSISFPRQDVGGDNRGPLSIFLEVVI